MPASGEQDCETRAGVWLAVGVPVGREVCVWVGNGVSVPGATAVIEGWVTATVGLVVTVAEPEQPDRKKTKNKMHLVLRGMAVRGIWLERKRYRPFIDGAEFLV